MAYLSLDMSSSLLVANEKKWEVGMMCENRR